MRPRVPVQNEQINEGVNKHFKNIVQTEEQRPELPMVTFTWHKIYE